MVNGYRILDKHSIANRHMTWFFMPCLTTEFFAEMILEKEGEKQYLEVCWNEDRPYRLDFYVRWESLYKWDKRSSKKRDRIEEETERIKDEELIAQFSDTKSAYKSEYGPMFEELVSMLKEDLKSKFRYQERFDKEWAMKDGKRKENYLKKRQQYDTFEDFVTRKIGLMKDWAVDNKVADTSGRFFFATGLNNSSDFYRNKFGLEDLKRRAIIFRLAHEAWKDYPLSWASRFAEKLVRAESEHGDEIQCFPIRRKEDSLKVEMTLKDKDQLICLFAQADPERTDLFFAGSAISENYETEQDVIFEEYEDYADGCLSRYFDFYEELVAELKKMMAEQGVDFAVEGPREYGPIPLGYQSYYEDLQGFARAQVRDRRFSIYCLWQSRDNYFDDDEEEDDPFRIREGLPYTEFTFMLNPDSTRELEKHLTMMGCGLEKAVDIMFSGSDGIYRFQTFCDSLELPYGERSVGYGYDF